MALRETQAARRHVERNSVPAWAGEAETPTPGRPLLRDAAGGEFPFGLLALGYGSALLFGATLLVLGGEIWQAALLFWFGGAGLTLTFGFAVMLADRSTSMSRRRRPAKGALGRVSSGR